MEEKLKQEIIALIKDNLKTGLIKAVTEPTGRFYITSDDSLKIPITTTEETLLNYKKLIIDKDYFNVNKINNNDTFNGLPRVSIYVGKPDTGKTYSAIKYAEDLGIPYLFIMARETLTLETLLQDFTVIDGKPVFKESLAIKMLSDPDNKPAIIIVDEFNTTPTGIMKTLQPIFDDTSKTFEFNGTIYKKNLNCKFILTLNDRDKGISIIPNAILSRSYVKYFNTIDANTLSKWTGIHIDKVKQYERLYELLGLSSIFGSRQLKILKDMHDINVIKNHLKGLLSLKNINDDTAFNKLDTLEYNTLINSLI